MDKTIMESNEEAIVDTGLVKIIEASYETK